jgi:hypothetical protein
MGSVVGRTQPGRLLLPHPGAAVAPADQQRPELVKPETEVREVRGDMLDPVQLGVPVRVGGLLPGPGALEAEPTRMQDLPRPLPADRGQEWSRRPE